MPAASGSFLTRAGPLVMARFLSACLTLVIPLVLARTLELSEYGTYKQLFLIAQSLYYVLPFGMAQSLYYFIPRAREERPYFVQTLVFLAGAGTLAGVALFALGPAIAHLLNNPQLLEHRTSLALYCGCTLGALPLELSMTAQGKTRQSAIAYLVSDGLRAAVLVLPVLLGHGLHQLMEAVVVYSVARLFVCWALVVPRASGPLFDGRRFARQLAYAAPFGAAVLFSVPQTYAHQFMVSSVVTPAAFAIYAVGCFQLPLVDLLYTPTSEVLMVRLGELDRTGRGAEGVEEFREAVAHLAYVFFPLGVFLFAAAPEFIGAVFGTRFLPAVPIFRVCVLAIPLAIFPLDGTLRARGRTQHIFASYVVKALVTAPMVYFGVKAFGMQGGIASWVAAELVGKAMLVVRLPAALSTPERRVGWVELAPWRALAQGAGAAFVAAIGVVASRHVSQAAWDGLPHTFVYRLLPLAMVGGTFTAGYFLVLKAVGVSVGGFLGWRRYFPRTQGVHSLRRSRRA
ncbi:MAG: lipopolysaccharide biosynthesis protein [Myxococcota bacterium]